MVDSNLLKDIKLHPNVVSRATMQNSQAHGRFKRQAGIPSIRDTRHEPTLLRDQLPGSLHFSEVSKNGEGHVEPC